MESAESWAKGQGLSIWQPWKNPHGQWGRSRLGAFGVELGAGLGALLNVVLPQACLLCAQASGDAPVCAGCAAQLPCLPPELAALCPVCAHPHVSSNSGANADPTFAADSGVLTCGQCLARPRQFDATQALYAYAAPADALIQAMKYRRRLASADFLALALTRHTARLPSPVDRILPMPLSPQRLAERGFNQAVELARPVARALGRPLDLSSVQRIHHRAPQMTLPWKARAANVRNVFRCAQDFAGEHVLVIDDVMTTGATLDELARVLKQHGAARVSNMVVARTLRHGSGQPSRPEPDRNPDPDKAAFQR